MVGIQKALLSALVALIPEAIAASPYCKGGIPAIVASGLAIYQPAVTYCSRSFPVPEVTSTRTAATTTITNIVGTVTSLTTVATSTNTVVAPAVFSTVTAATNTESQSTTVDTTTFTSNSEVTSTSTSTVFTISIIQKRDAATEIEKRVPQATATKNAAASSALGSLQKSASPYIQSVCNCLETPVTTYAVLTPSTTALVTATIYSGVTNIVPTTVTPTSTVSVTDLTTLTVPITDHATITVTNTVATVVTTTQVVQYRGPICNQPNMQPGAGGCSSNCYCDPRTPGGQAYGVCDTAIGCSQAPCSSDSDCNVGESCADYGCSQGPVCVNYQGCSSSFVPNLNAKRGLEGFERMAKLKQRQTVDETAADLLTCRQQGIMPGECLA